MRLWQRALKRSGIPLALTEGFNPHPRMSTAVPLAIEITSEAELMDIFCTRQVSPHWFTAAAGRQLPAGISIMQAYPVSLMLPSLQAQVRYAEYTVKVETVMERNYIEEKLTALMAAEHLPWQHQRDTGIRSYDIRALIDGLWLIDTQQPYCTLGMRLRCDNNGSGRPEQVALALGFDRHPESMHRTRLILNAA